MASQSHRLRGVVPILGKFNYGIGKKLPQSYRKFYDEWQNTPSTAVHDIPEEGMWKFNERSGIVDPVQYRPIPVKYPEEHNSQLWGGEGVVQGFTQKNEKIRRFCRYYFPKLKRSVVYSEVLNKHMSVIVTERLIKLVNSSYGFDHYLLKTPACDLKSLLACALKRKVLQELSDGCPAYSSDQQKQQEILNTYGKYLESYTKEEIDWYGLSFWEACKKMQDIIREENVPVPLKNIYREQLIEKLKLDEKIEKAADQLVKADSTAWIKKINPFSKKET